MENIMISSEESSQLSINAMCELRAADNFEHILRMKLALQQVDSNLLSLRGGDSDIEQLSESATETKDMHSQILNMVKSFEIEAKQNTNEENVQNLKQLTEIKKEMDSALNQSKQTPEEIAEQFTNEFFETEKENEKKDVDTEEGEIVAQPKVVKVEMKRKLIKQKVAKKVVANMNELNMNENAKTYEGIKNNISILSAILPKLKDAGQRAGLVKKFSPKIEVAMAELEKNIMDEKNEKAQVKISKAKNLVSSIVKAKLAEKQVKIKEEENNEIGEAANEGIDDAAGGESGDGTDGSGNSNFVDGAISQESKIKTLESQISRLENKNKQLALNKSIKDKQNRLKKLKQIQEHVANSKAVQNAKAKLAQAHKDKLEIEANANIEAIVSTAQGEVISTEDEPVESPEETASSEVVVPIPIVGSGEVKADPEIEDPEEEIVVKQKVLKKAEIAVKKKESYAMMAKKNQMLKKQLLKNKQEKLELLRKLNQQKEIQTLQQKGLSLDLNKIVKDEEKFNKNCAGSSNIQSES